MCVALEPVTCEPLRPDMCVPWAPHGVPLGQPWVNPSGLLPPCDDPGYCHEVMSPGPHSRDMRARVSRVFMPNAACALLGVPLVPVMCAPRTSHVCAPQASHVCATWVSLSPLGQSWVCL